MVKQLYSVEETEGEIRRYGLRFITLMLTDGDIARWRKGGHFRFLKTQLADIHSLRFMCTQAIGGCQYTFLAPSAELISRIANMVGDLITKGRETPLTRCDNSAAPAPSIKESKTLEIVGNPKACSLFF